MRVINIGDVVVHREGPLSGYLACGSGIYTHAICVSVEPFVLISQEGDMLWRCLEQDNFIGLCKADRNAAQKAFARYTRESKPAHG